MYETSETTYPNVSQSFGIMGLTILSTLIFSPIAALKPVIGKELALLITYVLSFSAAFILFYFIRKKKTGISTFNLSLKNYKIIPLAILGILALGIGVTDPLVSLIPMPDLIKKIFIDALGNPDIYTFITIVIAAPILEELIFRGIILDGLLKRYSPMKSILISSLIFGIVHMNPWQFIGAMILGSFLGWIYYKTKSIIPSIIMHSVNNLVGFLSIAILGKENIDTSLVQLAGGAVNATLIIVGSIVIFLGSIYLLQKQFAKE